MGRAGSMNGKEKKNIYIYIYISDIGWKAKRKVTSLRDPSRRLVDNIKMHVGEIGWGGVYWIDLSQDTDQ
jgi:hypothetical protein